MVQCYAAYNADLEKPLAEKMFFLDRLPIVDVFFDIGCGDGAILAAVAQCYRARGHTTPELIGYDISPSQIARAKSLRHEGGAEFYESMNAVRAARMLKAGVECVILSSVIHEVMSQGAHWADFCTMLVSLDCRYIVVRDMGINMCEHTAPSCPQDVARVRCRPDMAELLKSFEGKWGNISTRANLAHFLLKYQWGRDWEAELAENYIALTNQDWFKLFPSPYRLTYFEHAPLKYLQDVVARDFGISFDTATHIKMIWEKG